MSTIKLISDEDIIRQYLEQHKSLTEALKETEKKLRFYGVNEFDHPSPENLELVASSQKAPTVRELIRKAVKSFSDDFTKDTIGEYIANHYPDRKISPNTLSVEVSNVAKEDKWDVVTVGTGGRATIYSPIW